MNVDSAQIERIVKEARNSLGKFCLEECKGYCCRKGYLALVEENVDTVTHGNREKFLVDGNLKLMSPRKYSLSISQGCPCLDMETFMCKIYTDKNKPKVCDDFPISLNNNMAIVSSRCLAVRENKLFGYMKELELLGCNVVECDSFVDIYMNMPDGVIDRK